MKQALIVFATLIFAFGILIVSVFRTASVKYGFDQLTKDYKSTSEGTNNVNIEYYLPYPGRVMPDSPLWALKAFRDKLWLLINTSPTKEAELMLLLADKRVSSSVTLFVNGKYSIGFSTLTKAEKYLEEASLQEEKNRISGLETTDFLNKIVLASLKHYEITTAILKIAPDEVRPSIINIQEYSKKVFERSRNALLDKGLKAPQNPFDWE